MSRYVALLGAISLCIAGCKATSDCEEKLSLPYLDIALEMIEKTKHNVPKCCKALSNCEQKLPESYLDVAAEMILKAKHNFPECVSCDLTREVSDCSDLLEIGHTKSGVYTIWPKRMPEDRSLDVYCDMQTDGGGWTLIQRRGNFQRAEDYFFRDWESYKEGFGDIEKDFWLGNDNIFALTNQKNYSARFDLRDFENNTRYAQYDTFRIDDEYHKYTLHIEWYAGDAGDSMRSHNSRKFSTKDQDNDRHKSTNCAEFYKGAWWYESCYDSNLNGLYLRSKDDQKGIIWGDWKRRESLESTEIKIRPKTFKIPRASLNTLK